MKPFFLKSLGFTLIQCLVFGTLAGQNTGGTFSMLDQRALKEELGQRDYDKVWSRLEATAVDEATQEIDSFKLCQTLMALQSADEWRGNQEVLNPIMEEILAGIGEVYPEDLKAEERDQGKQLVLMGKLYEKYLYDRDKAKLCYLKVVNRLLANERFPESAKDWKQAVSSVESRESLNADERYAFKRLQALRQQEEAIAGRLASAREQKAYEDQMKTVARPIAPEFNPDDSIPFEELRQKFLNEGGEK